MDRAQAGSFLDLVPANPLNRAILDRLPLLGVDDAWLVAGCLIGTVWNARSGQSPDANIKDYDIFIGNPTLLGKPRTQ